MHYARPATSYTSKPSYLSPTKLHNSSVFAEMSFLLFGFLLLRLVSNCVSAKQTGLEVDVAVNEIMFKNENSIGVQVKELMQKVESMDISWKTEKADLDTKLEAKNTEVENLQKRVKEGEELMQRVEGMEKKLESKNTEVENLESRVEEEIAGLKMQIADFQNQCKAEVKSELEKVLPKAVEKGLRDLPFEMVCAYKYSLLTSNSNIITYDRISLEFNNSDRPGGLLVQIYSDLFSSIQIYSDLFTGGLLVQIYSQIY